MPRSWARPRRSATCRGPSANWPRPANAGRTSASRRPSRPSSRWSSSLIGFAVAVLALAYFLPLVTLMTGITDL